MNAVQIDQLKVELQKPEYAPLVQAQRWQALADVVNAPPRSETANPDQQGTVTVLPSGAADLMPMLSNAEKAAATSTTWRDLAATLYAGGDAALGAGTVGDAVDAVSISLRSAGVSGVYVDQVVDALIEHEGGAGLIGTFLALLQVGGVLSADTVTAISASLTQPDPAWSAVVYSYGDSVATTQGWPRVTEADVIEAVTG